jgi:hypothetical protein
VSRRYFAGFELCLELAETRAQGFPGIVATPRADDLLQRILVLFAGRYVYFRTEIARGGLERRFAADARGGPTAPNHLQWLSNRHRTPHGITVIVNVRWPSRS